MKRKLFCLLIVTLCFILVGCGNKEENAKGNNNTLGNSIYDVLPNKVNFYVTYEDKNSKESYDITRIGDDLFYSLETADTNDTIKEKMYDHYYFYKYHDKKWDYYVFSEDTGWVKKETVDNIDNVIDKVNLLFEKPLDNAKAAEDMDMAFIGSVKTVLSEKNNTKYYYANDLKLNIKVVTNAFTITVERYNVNIDSFNLEVPR